MECPKCKTKLIGSTVANSRTDMFWQYDCENFAIIYKRPIKIVELDENGLQKD